MTPEEAKQRSDLEQSLTYLTKQIPSVCWNMHTNLIEEGFTKTEAFSLVVAYVLGTFSGGIKPQ